jgi:prophage regulatory protein
MDTYTDRLLKALESLADLVRDRHHRSFLEDYHPSPDYATSISNGMISGTICEADTDCSEATGADSAPAAAADDDGGGDPDPEPERQRPQLPHTQAIAPTSARAPERRTATATAGESPPRIDPESELWRLPAVLAHVPISRSSWFAGVKSGRYPKPIRISERRVAWRASEIRSFVASL